MKRNAGDVKKYINHKLNLACGKGRRVDVCYYLLPLKVVLYQKKIFFRKQLCGKPSHYRDSRPDFKMSLFRSRVVIVNE